MLDDDHEELAEIRAVLARHEDLGADAVAAAPALWPDYDLDWLAERWQDVGFSSLGVEHWLTARCFSPWAARELSTASVPPELTARVLDDAPSETIGFRCSTRQLSITDALAMLAIRTVVLDEHEMARLEARSADAAVTAESVTRSLGSLEDLAAAGAIMPANAGHVVAELLTALGRVGRTLTTLSSETYRPLAHALRHDQLDPHESAEAAALSLADAIDELAEQLDALRGAHSDMLLAGQLAVSHFGLRITHPTGRDPETRYTPDAR